MTIRGSSGWDGRWRWTRARSSAGRRSSACALPLERRLVGLAFDGEPRRGVPLAADGRIVGRVTSCGTSPVLGRAIGLGWLRAVDGVFPDRLAAGPVAASVVEPPFYDPEGARLRA
jgi:glycine cleavage system aminomethyltransferase T